jgi:hypothetical protein
LKVAFHSPFNSVALPVFREACRFGIYYCSWSELHKALVATVDALGSDRSSAEKRRL